MKLERPSYRVRRQVRIGGGSIQVADDDRGSACFVCGSHDRVRFLQFNSPVRGTRMFLRICDGCITILTIECAMLVQEEQHGT